MEKDQISTCYTLLASLYVCGERFLNRLLRSAVFAQIIRLVNRSDKNGSRWAPNGEVVNVMYRGTPAGSPGRRLMVDIHTKRGCKNWLSSSIEKKFVIDMASALYDKAQGLPKKDLTAEKYMHSH